jgi:ATP-dependent helicase/nuclease subunit A
VLTFTTAAAAEMRETVGKAIGQKLNQHPGSRHLHRQLTLLNRAAITTIHSFCLEVLKQYYYRLNLDPVFRVTDDTEAALLRMEALEEILEESYSAGEEDFLSLVDAYGGDRDDTRLQEMVLKLYEFASGNPWPEQWLQAMGEAYRPQGQALDELAWGKSVLAWVELRLLGLQNKLERALILAAKPAGPEVYISTLREDLVLVGELVKSTSCWSALEKAFTRQQFSNLKQCRDINVDDNLKERVKKIRDEVKKKATGIKAELFERPEEELLADLEQMAPLIDQLIGLVSRFSRRYSQLKKAKGLVDFSDLEHYCLAILSAEQEQDQDQEQEQGDGDGDADSQSNQIQGNNLPSAVALELREHYAEVLVDEYQDTNGVQEAILQLVSRQGSPQPNLFMVGDVKQSIYRFRLAEPALFMAKYQSYPREAGGSEQGVDLAKNFRSRQQVVEGVNFIFRQLMTPRVGELVYDHNAELVCGAQFPQGSAGMITGGGAIELHILEKAPKENSADNAEDNSAESTEGWAAQEPAWGEGDSKEGDPGSSDASVEAAANAEQDNPEELDAIQREARLVAARIRQLVLGTGEGRGPEFNVLDKQTGSYRPVRFRDIVILMRATRGTANTYLEEFRQAGIPGYADLGTGYFAATEVETMMSLLKVIDNPRQDIPLTAVLRSAIVGLNGEELAQVRLGDLKGDFYAAVCQGAKLKSAHEMSAGVTPEGVTLGEVAAEAGLAPEGGLAPAVTAKLRKFLQHLECWRTMARQGSLADLVWRLYTDTGYYAYVGAMPGGAQRQANLRALYDRARQYEATSFRGLFRFLRFIEKFQQQGSDLGTARALGENEDVVRIMSIHKSKGLEFPVVIVTGMGKQFNLTDLKKTTLLHKELGLGLPFVNIELKLSYPSLAQLAIKKRLELELLAEEMRILYVAMTRAKEKLILVGSVQAVPKCAVRWCEQITHQPWNLPDPDLAEAKTFLDWVAPAVARHQDGLQLRLLAGIEGTEVLAPGPISQHPSCWQVFSWQAEDCRAATAEGKVGQDSMLGRIAAGLPLELPEQLAEELRMIDSRLSWKYPWADVVGKPVKATVTELKRSFSPLEEEQEGNPLVFNAITQEAPKVKTRRSKLISRPRFLQERSGLSPTEKGSAMHMVMQHINFQADLSLQGIREQVARLELAELLTAEQAATIDIAAIASFFTSPLGQRVIGNTAVQRELPFTIALPEEQVYPELPTGGQEKILVQGVIDALIDEGDGLVLIDYKTDYVGEKGLDQLVENYRGQLNLYAYALEAILGRPVKEKHLYLFACGTSVQV